MILYVPHLFNLSHHFLPIKSVILLYHVPQLNHTHHYAYIHLTAPPLAPLTPSPSSPRVTVKVTASTLHTPPSTPSLTPHLHLFPPIVYHHHISHHPLLFFLSYHLYYIKSTQRHASQPCIASIAI